MPLAWKRPVSSEYPKIWHTFFVRGEKFVIQDLPESMTEAAIKFMLEKGFPDEPVLSAYNLHRNAFYLDHCASMYRTEIIKQKAALVCFKDGSDDIVGLNINYVKTVDDSVSMGDFWRDVSSTCQQMYRICTDRKYSFRSLSLFKRNLGRCRELQNLILPHRIGTDVLLTSVGLCVDRNYRGRGIAVEILKTRRQFCREFNIRLTQSIFTSDIADACAEKAGFKLIKRLRYDDIRIGYLHLKVPLNINSTAITYRSMRIDEHED